MRTILLTLLLTGCTDTFIVGQDVESPLDGHWTGALLYQSDRIDSLDLWIDFSGPMAWQGNAQRCVFTPSNTYCVEQYAYIKGEPEDFALDLTGGGSTQGFAARLEGDRILLYWRGATEDGREYHLERQ